MIQLGNKAVVTDPCYGLGTVGTKIVDNVKPGTYISSVRETNEGIWGMRVAHLQVVHQNYQDEYLDWQEQATEIWVDSGQCGVYDFAYRDNILGIGEYDEPDSFYGKACKCTDDDVYGEQDDKGVTSRSGFGDGAYDLYLAKDNEQVVGFRIVFIDDTPQEDEQDWDEEDE